MERHVQPRQRPTNSPSRLTTPAANHCATKDTVEHPDSEVRTPTTPQPHSPHRRSQPDITSPGRWIEA